MTTRLESFKALLDAQKNQAVPEAISLDLIVAYQETAPLLTAVATELADFLRVMSGEPSRYAFGTLVERLEIVMHPLMKEDA